MAKARVIVFDLFETLLHDIKFDFNSGLSYLHENILSKDTDKVEFLDYAATYWKELYDKRSVDNSELAFDDIKKYDTSIKMEQVYFIGDNFKADVLGAESFGFTPVFINRKHDSDINSKNFIEIKSLNELLEVIR